MRKLNKKLIFVVIVVLLLAVFSAIYFAPQSLANIANENSTLYITKVDMHVNNGQIDNENTNYNEVTEPQKAEILKLFDEYRYTRNFGTLFSNGSMSGNGGEGYCYITVYDKSDYIGTIVVAYDDEISVGNKNYTMQSSAQFIDNLFEIVG